MATISENTNYLYQYEQSSRSSKYANGASAVTTAETKEAASESRADSVSISPAAAKLQNAAESNYIFAPLLNHTTDDNTQITLEAAPPDENGEYQAVKVTITDAEGNSHSEIIHGSVVLSRNEDGSYSVQPADGQNLTGTDQDDIFIVLPKAGEEYREIQAGEGNNVVLNLGYGHTKISAGSGNDSIVGLGLGEKSYDIATGAGDDSISLRGDHSTLNVDAGEGDDSIDIMGGGIHNSSISGGSGDDTITVRTTGAVNSTISGDDGNDSIDVNWLSEGSSVEGGEGDDSINISRLSDTLNVNSGATAVDGGGGNDTITVGNSIDLDSDTEHTISGGDGDDSISIGSAIGGVTISGGNGNDTISGGTLHHSDIDGGEGDDSISFDRVYNSTITGGEGDDTIEVEELVDSSINGDTPQADPAVSLASGNPDSLEFIAVAEGEYTGSGHDEPSERTIGSTHNTEKPKDAQPEPAAAAPKKTGGNDSIRVGSATNSEIQGGGGDDSIKITKAENSGIGGGEGDDQIDVETATDSVIAGDKLDWDRQAAIDKYMKAKGREEKPGFTATWSSTDQPAASSADAAAATDTEKTDQELFMDALIRGDRTHPLVRKLLEQREKLNIVA